MKKIMFNDRYGLTTAVLEGRKTTTRRIIPEMVGRQFKKKPYIVWDAKCYDCFLVFKDKDDLEPILLYPRYKVGEVVAVAQAYKDCVDEILINQGYKTDIAVMAYKRLVGWRNKMFVKACLMPHQIRITHIRVEKLQDISDEDCLREGVCYCELCKRYTILDCDDKHCFETPREAFAALIDKVSGKGTWESNPYCFVYEFELVN